MTIVRIVFVWTLLMALAGVAGSGRTVPAYTGGITAITATGTTVGGPSPPPANA